jgi:hypothetical protein
VHPKTEKLISELKTWCDEEYGRRSEIARLLNASPSVVSDWFAGRRTPSLDQGFMIKEFLRKQRHFKRATKSRPISPEISVSPRQAQGASTSLVELSSNTHGIERPLQA